MNVYPTGTTFCLKAGTHNLLSSIIPKSGDAFIGQYGAILDGGQWVTSDPTQAAFRGFNVLLSNVTIRNLVIRNMPQNGIATAYSANSHWTIDHNEVFGARTNGISFPDTSTVEHNYIHHNGGYGFTGYMTSGTIFRNNEVAFNNACNCYPEGGASKLAGTTNASVVGNYIHDNGGNGIWFDTNNSGVLIANNTVSVNATYGKAISMEQNNGSAVIRDNAITVGPGGEVAIIVNNSSHEQIYNNIITTSSPSNGGAIHVYFDASRTGYDTADIRVSNNQVTLQGSATIAASVSCSNVTSCTGYWTTKGNVFQGNTYRVPTPTGKNWMLTAPVTWSQWQSAGYDT